MQKMSTCLWFNEVAHEAAKFYTSIFKDGRIFDVRFYSNEGSEKHGHKEGDVLTVEFEIMGHNFLALNGGPQFPFNESISFIVNCDTQEEIDYYWNRLKADGGIEVECGWLRDKYGVSWQVAPVELQAMLKDKDQKRVDRVFKSFMQMKKFDINELRKAYGQDN